MEEAMIISKNRKEQENYKRTDVMQYGYTIADRYICRKSLGRGGGGSVWLAYDKKLEKYWAVKCCFRHDDREVEALKKIDNYAFPRIVDVVAQDEREYMVMDYVEGETLASYLRKHSASDKQILMWAIKIANALKYLHSLNPVLLYMDCKPDNIMLTKSGDIRLIDLGSVYVCDDNVHNSVSGTVFYAPGEVKNGKQIGVKPDERSDIYSFGMTLYYLFTGSKTEYRDSRGRLMPTKCNKHVSEAVEHIICKCTAPGMEDRYSDFDRVSEALKNICYGKGNVTYKAMQMIKISLEMAVKTCSAMAIIFMAAIYQKYNNMYILLCMLLLTVFFLLMCRSRRFYVLERSKNVYKTAGSGILLSILVGFAAVGMCGGNVESQAQVRSEDSILHISLYDGYGRKLLIRPGSVWKISDDINMSIDKEEFEDGPCTITVLCDNGSEIKEYTFMADSQ